MSLWRAASASAQSVSFFNYRIVFITVKLRHKRSFVSRKKNSVINKFFFMAGTQYTATQKSSHPVIKMRSEVRLTDFWGTV